MKITLIGAGSVVFAKNLISDILQFPELSDTTICLMDIDPARLKVAVVMAQKIVAKLKLKARIIGTPNQREAVRGARYVICTIQVGGYKPGTVIDFEIPRKYGVLQTIGDTLGVGGIFRALRTIPVINSIARDIADVGGPDCLLLNYTNPMAMNCMAVARGVGIPHVGLCHSVQGTSQQLASYLGLPYKDITYLVAGINHMAFFLKFEYRGQDAYPLLFQLLENGSFQSDKVRFEMMRRTGYFVTESSEHQSEYTPYFIHHGEKVREQFSVPIDEYLRRCDSVIKIWESMEAALIGTGDDITINAQSHEYGSYIIHSCETNTPRVVYGNVPNTQLIDNLPAEACVELPCLVDAQGIQPTHIGMLPRQLAALCQTNLNVQSLTVEAALTGRREHIYHALMLDPHTASVLTLDKMWALCDEMIAAHQKVGLLGKFAPSIPGTGRALAGTGDRVLARIDLDAKAKTGTKMEAKVSVTNPRTKPFDVTLRVTCRKPDGALLSTGPTVKLRVPAGKTVKKAVTLSRPASDDFILRLDTANPEILVRDGVGMSRGTLAGNSPGGAAISLKLAGFPAAEGRLEVRNGTHGLKESTVVLTMSVDDSKIIPSDLPSSGSSLELYFANAAGHSIREFFVVPDRAAKKARVLNIYLEPAVSASASVRPGRTGAGYEVKVELPMTIIGLKENEPFLFDLIANITALGDAHSGGRTSLSGSFDTANSLRFFRVEA